jgi:hypothetical protein
MPFQKISGNFVELSVDNYIGTIRAGGTVSDLGFKTYKESNAGQAPISGTGGSPGISLSLNTTAPLSSDADLRLVKDSTNRQGEGFAVDFTIQNRHIAKVLQISFDTELISGTYTNPSTTQSGTFTVVSTSCTITANHSLIAGQSVYVNFPGGTSPVSGQYVITSVVAGVSFTFTVASGSGTGVACTWQTRGSLRVYIIQNPTTSPIVIEPVNTDIQYGIANQKIKHIASFQTGAVGTSYRLIIHVGNNSINAYTINFNNFKIWETTQSIGSVITDWQSYPSTTVVQGWGTVNTSQLMWRRYGGNIEILGRITSGTVSASEIQFPLPSGLITSNNIQSGRYNKGYYIRDASQTSINKFPIIIQPTKNYFNIGLENSSSTNALSPANGNSITSNESGSIETSIPIQGWGSNVAMSSDTGDGRVVSGRYTTMTSTGSLTANTTTLKFSTLSKDTHNIYNPATGVLTIPISGDYYFLFGELHQGTIDTRIRIYINNYASDFIGIVKNAGFNNISGFIPNLKSGDLVDFRFANNVTTTQTSAASFSWYRISAGTQQIASSENFNLQYTTISNSHNSSGNLLDLIYTTLVKDSHGAYNTTTGIFTAPMSGCYDIEAQVVFSANATGYRAIVITNTSNTFIARGTELNANAFVGNLGMASVSFKSYPMLAGQQIKIRYIQNSGGTLALSSDSTWNRLSITRVGNY